MRWILLLLAMPFVQTKLYSQNKMKHLYNVQKNTFLDSLLNKNEQLKPLLSRANELNIQIIYTRIDRDENNIPTFTDYTYQLNHNYFYPASTVKMPIAFLALEKLQELSKHGIDKSTTMITDSSYPKQTMVLTHPSAQNSNPTIEHYIKQIFLVSDNNAFNRIYEFLGQEYIQKTLAKKGYKDVAIRHRLETILTQEQNKATNAISFLDTSGKLLYQQPAQYSKAKFPNYTTLLGKGYYKGNQLINEPFNFSIKNRIYLEDLHSMLRSVIFAEQMPAKQRFNITEADRDFLLHWMSAHPKESTYPYYDSVAYWDNYCKFLLFGSNKKSPPPNIRVFNKVGDAYGFMLDVAYIIDTENKVEFMLSATISCNTDGIYNDDKYEYDTIGFPFMKNLGESIYQYELKRTKKHLPDLTKFTLNY